MFISYSLLHFSAERGLVTFLELLEREGVVLRPLVLDLDRAHEARDSARRLPVEVVEQTVEEPRAVRVAAARGVLDRLRLHGRNLVALLLRVDHRALAA